MSCDYEYTSTDLKPGRVLLMEEPDMSASHYTSKSIYVTKADEINELVDSHWDYLKDFISTTNLSRTDLMTESEYINALEFVYKSTAKHFFSHGYEARRNEEED